MLFCPYWLRINLENEYKKVRRMFHIGTSQDNVDDVTVIAE
jgi:hypothetical protein